MKYKSKSAWLFDTEQEWQRFWNLLAGWSEVELEARHRYGDEELAWSAKDVMAHVYEWHSYLLTWLKTGENGQPDLPTNGYNWRMTRELNLATYQKHANVPIKAVQRKLKLSHRRVLNAVESLTESQFSKPQQFQWTGKLALSSYIVPNTVSHYRWAQKKVRRFKKA